MTKDQVIEIIKQKYPYLKSEYGVKRMGLFGSFAKQAQTEASDIDILVEFERPIGLKFIELSEYMENILGRKTGLITPAGLSGIRVNGIAEDIKKNIIYV